ncbi:membrane-anchored DNA-binding protein, putative [Nostoc sp. PCC 7107]|nr:membrane-anchored DNA-binding protein, putative [Nostoc sp. PCC 7107]
MFGYRNLTKYYILGTFVYSLIISRFGNYLAEGSQSSIILAGFIFITSSVVHISYQFLVN